MVQFTHRPLLPSILCDGQPRMKGAITWASLPFLACPLTGTMMKTFATLSIAITAAALSACASVIVSDDAVVDRTAFALGLNKGDFTISNRVNEGASARYAVRTKSGQEFNCFLGSTLSILGGGVTEAVCNKKGEVGRNPLLR